MNVIRPSIRTERSHYIRSAAKIGWRTLCGRNIAEGRIRYNSIATCRNCQTIRERAERPKTKRKR